MKIDKTLLERQLKAVDIWEENNYEGTFEWATGSGKTYLSKLAAYRLIKKFNSISILVVVPSDYLRTQWTNNLEEDEKINNFHVDTVHMLVESKHKYDLVIFDEVHSYTGGEVHSTIFDCVNWKYVVGLTAQERDKEEDKIKLEKYVPIIDRLPMKEALDNGWVSPFSIYNLGLELSNSDRIRYNKMHNQFIKYFSTFDFDLGLMYKVLGKENNGAYLRRVARKLQWKEKIVFIHAVQANRVMTKRKEFLYKADPLFETTKNIVEKFPSKKIITFSELTSSCDRLTEMLEDQFVTASYHSSIPTEVRNSDGKIIARAVKVDGKTRYRDKQGTVYTWKQIKFAYRNQNLERFSGKRIKEEVIEKYKAGKIDVLNTAKALNVGVNVPNINFAILTSYNSSVVDSIQRTGRAVRKQQGKRAIEVNLYIKNTQSEKWLKSKQKETPNIQWINSIEEIV